MGKLEDASEDQGSSSEVADASKSCKKFLILSELRLLEVALISKSMGIKSPAIDLLCIQENKTTIIQFKITMNVQ